MSQHLHAGTITYLFTDIEGSTRLWEQHPEAMKSALGRHDALLRQAIETQGGSVVKTTGDGCLAAFSTVHGALQATLAAQQAIEADGWVELLPQTLRVSMALHTGGAEMRAGDYFGGTINRAYRLMSIGHGGQVLLSGSAAGLARHELPEGVGLLDLGEHSLKDLSGPEHVFQLKSPGLQADFPPLKTLEPRQVQAGEYAGEYVYPNNLPAQLTSFVGRQRELAETKELQSSARLLTLIGPGGTGKTRLSTQLAAELLHGLRNEGLEYPDGAWLVELAPVSDPELVLRTLAGVFNLRERPGIQLEELVLSYLQGRRLLLILDNCEHLIEACARLADLLLRHCPRLKMIASSREALGIAGERIYSVPSLGLPPSKTGENPEDLARSEAVQLFVERAAAVQPHFSLNEQNAAFVAQICRRLDGIPLAIELAAARARLLSPEQIAARLDDRFRLLTGGSRAALPRQQTLQALIDWSYDLLPEAERGLLRRLAVFAGGWSLEASEAIYPDFDVLDLLAQLANKSLVVVEETQAGPMRFRLLETIRQYGLERLLEVDETIQARDRHLQYFLQMAEETAPKLNGQYQQLWLNWLESEYDNLRAALTWSLENDRSEAGLRIAVGIYQFWTIRDYAEEGLVWMERLLAQADERVSPVVHANALAYTAFLAGFRGKSAIQIKYGHQAAILAEAAGEEGKPALKWALSAQAYGARAAGDFQTEYALMERIVLLNRESGDRYQLGLTLSFNGLSAMALGKYDAAQAMLDEALPLLREAGNPYRIAMALNFSGDLARCQQNYARAAAVYAESIYMLRELNAPRDLASVLHNLGHTCLHLGEIERAHTLFVESMAIQKAQQNTPGIAECLIGFAALAIVCGLPAAGARLLAAAVVIGGAQVATGWPATRMEYEHSLALTRASLSETEFQVEQARGQAFSLERAVAYVQSLPLNAPAARPVWNKPDELTVRESEIAALIALGKSNGEIADELVVSKRTVEKHIAHIILKLGVTNRAQIVRWGIETGLAKPTR